MKDQTINANRSIEIISQMIADTSANVERQSGKYFLLWGYTTVIVSLFEYVAQLFHMDIRICLWAWLLIPIVGGIGTIILSRAENMGAKSYLDRSINAVWMVFGLSFIMVYIAAYVYETNILFLTAMLMGMGTIITGIISRHKVLIYSAAGGLVLSLLLPLRHLLFKSMSDDAIKGLGEAVIYSEIAIFALIFVVMMIIPGHILRNRAKQQRDA